MTLWDDYWHAAVVQDVEAKEAIMVLYGYAFRNHWAWYNHYKDGIYSFIVWKDYHCGMRMSFDSSLDLPRSHDAFISNGWPTTVDNALDTNLNVWQNCQTFV